MSTHVSDSDLINALTAIGTALEAGVSLDRLVTDPVVSRTLPSRLVQPMASALERGGSAAEGFAASGLLRRHEVALLAAGEQSGSLVDGLRAVTEGVRRRVEGRRVLLGSLGYPMLLIVASGVILPLPVIVTEGVLAYLARAVWLPLIATVLGLVFGYWMPRLPATDPRRELPRRVGRVLPFVRPAMRHADAATFLGVLGQCVSAGLGMDDSLDAAASAVDDPAMRRAGATIRARIHAGARLAEAFDAARAFPPDAVAIIAQGELTGTLDQALGRAAEQEGERGRRQLRRVLLGFVGVVYALVVLFIGWRIVSGFVDVISTIEQATEF